MKKIGIILSACVLAFGCTDYKSQVAKLTFEKQALAYETHYKDSTITSFIQSFNEIEENLNQEPAVLIDDNNLKIEEIE